MRNIAIIPARSGSKGLKDKNIKELNGKPLIAYTIEAAKNSKQFDEIMVSTDSEYYSKIAKEWGAKVPFLRSETLATDTASSWNVVKDVLEKYKILGEDFESVALLQPTSPLRTEYDIIAGYEKMNKEDANAVVSVCKTDHSPLWSNILPENGALNNFLDLELINTPRQKLPVYYRINGALYIVKCDYLMKTENIYENKAYAIVMSKRASIDIDEELDFIVAEAIMRNDTLLKSDPKLRKKQKPKPIPIPRAFFKHKK